MGANLLTNAEGSMVNSALLKNESVESVLEYAPNKMAVTLHSPADLLIVHDWVVIKYIKISTIGDNRKHWVAALPNFNIETFPFILCSGKRAISLINVETFHSDVLVNTSSQGIAGQDGAIFKDGSNDLNMYFPSRTSETSGIVNYKVHLMQFKEDFVKILQKLGRLPDTSLKTHIN